MKFSLSLVFSGLIFFFNPCFNLFDILPDFIGAILIMTGISKMYMYDGDFENARKSAKFLLWISVLRLVLCLWINAGGRNDYLVPFTFIVCVLEAIYMIALYKGLYLGLEYTLMRADCEKQVKYANEAFTMSFIFTAASKLLEFAPHICDIYAQDAELDLSSGASFKMSAAQLKTYILAVCLVCSLIVGIIYLFVTAKAWTKAIGNKNYVSFLKGKYENYLETERDAHLATAIKKVYFLVTFAFAFFADFYIDGINLIPSAVGIILMFCASLYLQRYDGTKKSLTFAIALPAAVCSCLSSAFMTRVHFGINHLYVTESYNKEEFALLNSEMSVILAAIFALLELILTLALVLFVINRMRAVFAREKRRVALPMLKFLTVPASLCLIATALRKVLTTLEGHLATNEYVLGYVQGKAYITNKELYDAYMQNPLISRYESISSVSYAAAFISALLAIICILYMTRISRFTDD